MLGRFALLGFLVIATAAHGQQANDVDPRLIPTLIPALRAQIALQEAAMRAMKEDDDRTALWWAQVWKALPPPPAPVAHAEPAK